MYTISKDIGINKEKEICLPNKETIHCHRCEEKIWLLNLKCLRIVGKMYRYMQKTNMTAKQGIFQDHRCEGTNMDYKCQIFEAVSLTLHMYVQFQKILA